MLRLQSFINAQYGTAVPLLGDDIHEPRYIATVPTVGYRLVCKVEVSEEPSGSLNPSDERNGLSGSDFARVPETPPAPEMIGEKQPAIKGGKFSLLYIGGLFVVLLGIGLAAVLLWRADHNRDRTGVALAHLAIEKRVTSNPPEVPVSDAVVSRDGKYVTPPTWSFICDRSQPEKRIGGRCRRALLRGRTAGFRTTRTFWWCIQKERRMIPFRNPVSGDCPA